MATPTNIDKQLRRGVRSIQETYDAVEQKIGGRQGELLYRRALRNTFRSLVQAAKQATPAATGRLRRNIFIRPAPRRQRQEDFFAIQFGYFRPRPYHKALAVEFGNRHVVEAAALRQSWRRHQAGMVSTITVAIQDAIEEEVRKLHTKLQRQRRTP